MATNDRQATIDRLGALEEKLAPFKAELKEAETLRKAIRSWPELDEIAGTAHAQYPGQKFDAMLLPCENRSRITSMPKLFKFVGKDSFLANCSFTLKALEALKLAPPKGLIVVAPTGPREVHIVKKAQ